MATDQRNLPCFFNGNADFQAWVQGIHAQLAASGMIQTSDTGQINPATVALPGVNTVAGYEIWRFNDSIQSTNPFFIKVEYGVRSVTSRPSFFLTVGTSTNGSGTITGVSTSRQEITSNVTYAASQTLPSYASGDGSYIALMTNQDSAQNGAPLGFIVDRIRDATGIPTGEGITVALNQNNSGQNVGFAQSIVGTQVGAGAGSGTSTPTGIFPGPSSGMSFSAAAAIGGGVRLYGQSLGVLPLMVMAGQLRYLKCAVMYSTTELSNQAGVTFQANNLGANHTYMTTASIVRSWGDAQNTSDQPAILWE